ncbi:MAG: hypothetical protein ACE5GE_02620, partial [Phycisphaerae bacterium]
MRSALNVDAPTTQTPTPQPVDQRRSQPSDVDTDSAQPFAAMLTALQSGFGRGVTAKVPGLNQDTQLLGSPEGDARSRRLAKMSDRADAGRAAGRGSRLAALNAAGGAASGPRGQRLALLAEQQSQQAPANSDEGADLSDRGIRLGVGERKVTASDGRITSPSGSAGGEARSSGGSESPGSGPRLVGNGSTSGQNDRPILRGPAIGPAEGGGDGSGLDRTAVPVARGLNGSNSKPAFQPAAGRGGAVEGVRAVSGAEQTGQG